MITLNTETEIAATGFIPHRGPMQLIDSLSFLDSERMAGQVRLRLKADAPYFLDQEFQNHWLIEICAQASAAVSQARRGGLDTPVVMGYLVSIRQFQMAADIDLKIGDDLLIDVVFEVEMDPVGQSRCTVMAGGQSIADGELTFLSADKE